ncbi:MAG: replication protein RepA [Candidatus Dormibacteria bacterium]
MPRLLLAWVTTEAVRTKTPELLLGPSLSSFMAQLQLAPTGGRWGTIPRLRKQMERLFSSAVGCTYADAGRTSGQAMNVALSHDLWWDPKRPDQAALWQSTVTLGTDFFNEIVARPVPIATDVRRESLPPRQVFRGGVVIPDGRH